MKTGLPHRKSKVVKNDFFYVARRGASLAAERVGAERRRKSEAQPNREGVASGSATTSLQQKLFQQFSQSFDKPHN